jgi:hypothetical protein
VSERTMIEVEITFPPLSQGGRNMPDGILNGYSYRPHLVIGGPEQRHPGVIDGNLLIEDYLGIAFASGPDHIEAGRPCIAQAALLYMPAVDYSAVVPGAAFTLREGDRIVAHGRVTRRWTEPQ